MSYMEIQNTKYKITNKFKHLNIKIYKRLEIVLDLIFGDWNFSGALYV